MDKSILETEKRLYEFWTANNSKKYLEKKLSLPDIKRSSEDSNLKQSSHTRYKFN